MQSPLRTWREGLSLTQLELAQVAGVSQGHVSDVENGHTQICKKLSAFLKEKGGEALALADRQAQYMDYVKHQLEAKVEVEGQG